MPLSSAPGSAENPVARAQRRLGADKRIHVAAGTDALLGPDDRYIVCHFPESGQRKTAMAYALAIVRSRHFARRPGTSSFGHWSRPGAGLEFGGKTHSGSIYGRYNSGPARWIGLLPCLFGHAP